MPQPKTKTRPPTRGAKNRSTGLVEPQSVIPSPSKPLLPKGVAKARLKHQFDLIPPPSLSTASPCPTLGDRFFALPIELRNKIYELLIVSPPRWAVEHLPTCSAPPSWDLAHEAPFSLSCLRCRRYHRRWDPIPWKLNPYHGKDGPLKSSWSPPRGNPYLCNDCYTQNFRPKPYPSLKDVSCLCHRRPNLDLLLCNKQISAEASQAFWSTNTFCFGHHVPLVRFLPSIPPEKRNLITKISFLASYPEEPRIETSGVEKPSWKSYSPIPWNLLATCTNLSHLDLDVFFLVSLPVVKHLRKIYGLSRVTFSVRGKKRLDVAVYAHTKTELAPTTVVRGGYVEDVARMMKRDRQSSVKEVLEIWKKGEAQRARIGRYAERWYGGGGAEGEWEELSV